MVGLGGVIVRLANAIGATFLREQPVGKLANNSISWYVVHIVGGQLTASIVSIVLSTAAEAVVGQCSVLSVGCVSF